MGMIFTMVDLILNQLIYLEQKLHTLFKYLTLRYSCITNKNVQKTIFRINRIIHLKTTEYKLMKIDYLRELGIIQAVL